VALTPKASAVLGHLVRHAGRLVTKQELLDEVWQEIAISDAVLKVGIREIRRALGDQAQAPQFIETVHRRGYRFIAPLGDTSQVKSQRAKVESQIREPVSNIQRLVPHLVGREAELAQLHQLLAKALSGKRQTVFVTGEAGIGKTAFVEEFLGQAAAVPDLCVARGQCLELYGAGEAYRPVLEALGQVCRKPGGETLITALADSAPTWLLHMPSLLSGADRERLQSEVLGATRERMLREAAETIEAFSTKRGFVLVLEDLQWSDYATLDLVSLLARRQEPACLLVIGTYRPVDMLVSGHPLRGVKQELQVHGQCTELALAFLDETAVAKYLASRFPQHRFPDGLARVIQERTDGNPLFTVNVVDYLIACGVLAEQGGQWELHGELTEAEQEVPETLRQLIERQMEQLGIEEQCTLEVASVVGMEFAAATVAVALQTEIAGVEEHCERLARRGQFLRSLGVSEWVDGTVTGCYGFIHALCQNVLYQRVAAARRIRLHRQIGEYEEVVYRDRARGAAAELAIHFEQGRDWGRAVQYLRQAAANALQRYANREAVSYLTRALNLVEQWPDQAEQVRLHLVIRQQLGLARYALGDSQQAAEDFLALAAYARTKNQSEWEVKALLYAAAALSWIDHERCLATAEQAVALSRQLGNKELHMHTAAYYGYWRSLVYGWRTEDAPMCTEAVELARQAEDRALLGLHLGRYLYFRCIQSEYHTVCRLAEEEMQAAFDARDTHSYATCQFFRAWALLHLGQWSEMLAVLQDGEQMAGRNQHPVWEMAFRLEKAWLYLQVGDWARARELGEQGISQALEVKHQYGQLLGCILLGWVHLGLGEYDQALYYFNSVNYRPKRILMDWILQMPLSLGLSEYWLQQGQFAQASQAARQLCTLAAQPGERTYLALGRRMLAEIALAQQKWEEAETEVAQAIAVLKGTEAPLAEWRVYATAALLYDQRCRKTEADQYWTRSAAVLQRLADLLGDEVELRHSLLTRPSVRTIFHQARSSS